VLDAWSNSPLWLHALLIYENLAIPVARSGAHALVCDAFLGAAFFSERLGSKPDVTIAPQIRQQAAFYYGRARHLLIATTALVATVGVAAAEVTISGDGRFGVVSSETVATAAVAAGAPTAAQLTAQTTAATNFAATPNATTLAALNAANDAVTAATTAAVAAVPAERTNNIESRVNLNFSASTETDGGVKLSVFSRVRTNNAQAGTFNAHRISASVSGLTATVGNMSGAIEANSGSVTGGFGYTGGSFASFGGVYSAGTDLDLYASNGAGVGQMAGLSYAMGGLTVGVTHQRDGDTEVAATYTMDGLTVSAGASDSASEYRTVRVGYNAGDFTVGVIATQFAGDNLVTVGGSYSMSDVGTFGAYFGDHAGDNVAGVSYRHSLGGGATFGVGIERLANGTDRAEAGVVFSF